jgi:hypothetical protein
MKRFFVIAIAVLAIALPAFAQAPVGLKAVGIQAGYVAPEDPIDATWGLGGYFDFGLPMANFSLSPFVDWWSVSNDDLGIEATFRDIAVGAKVKYHIPTSMPQIQPFVGAGIAAHLLKSEVDTGALLGTISVSDTKVGFHFGGGMQFGVAERVNLTAQGWYSVVDGFNQIMAQGGVAFTL